jgi:hypothetical protein
MDHKAYEEAVIELFSGGLATQGQWHEMATALKLISDDFVLRDLVVEIDAAVRPSPEYRPPVTGSERPFVP